MKKARFDLIPVFLVIFIILIINLAVLAVVINTNNRICEKACDDAITYDVKGESSVIGYFFGDYEINCICYYEDGVKTRRIKK